MDRFVASVRIMLSSAPLCLPQPSDSLYDQKPAEAPPPSAAAAAAGAAAADSGPRGSRFAYNDDVVQQMTAAANSVGGHASAPVAAGDFFADLHSGTTSRPVGSRPKPQVRGTGEVKGFGRRGGRWSTGLEGGREC